MRCPSCGAEVVVARGRAGKNVLVERIPGKVLRVVSPMFDTVDTRPLAIPITAHKKHDCSVSLKTKTKETP